ncbi:hypothetical protein PUNSTDRAFT_146103 [Punctularia strigosozonata HHB-11173 SS5]|uniref:Zinc finger Mcm10/DnaG-type domain-containing protein n=1 Tax=Punctularia strigosozonata (strain HHB-11173) TaxID=741275 RepID=R7S4V9_PUNST|nr:uncharacterized protein PUNSTDRAFT_146103 [Punctularia strigosozonata HHB-11173 SS5]EIN05263.1 hypothetical protein PUNSTDRAFT_146103 [Punctularia strigosozonata HHB-11173 SS5]
MESVILKARQQEERQAAIRAQIAALQAQLVDPSSASTSSQRSTGNLGGNISRQQKRKAEEHIHVLAPRTPSPKKKKTDRFSAFEGRARASEASAPSRPSSSSTASGSGASKPLPSKNVHTVTPALKPAASAVVGKLAAYTKQQGAKAENEEEIARSAGFADAPACMNIAQRDENLAIVEELQMGTGEREHQPPPGDPAFNTLEPNSGIRLSSRALPYEDFQEHLRGRFFLSPSLLYSVVRLLPNRAGYDVPVPGDWVTVAVVAERGPIKFSRAPVGAPREEDESAVREDGAIQVRPAHVASGDQKQDKGKQKQKEDKEAGKPHGKKYVSIKLVDFGARSAASSNSKATIRGDAFLTLLLFESDSVETVEHDEEEEDGRKMKAKAKGKAKEKVYKGGSRGAFEKMAKLKEGAVVALLNPRILKPFQRSADDPHPVTNILALTPESAASIEILGTARDLGMCTVTKRDGKTCGAWVDKRVADVCEWHVQHAVQSRRAARPEFSLGTSGMSSKATHKRKHDYDPRRQWGLKPEDNHLDGGGATYVVSGHVVSGSGSGVGEGGLGAGLFVGESLGREVQAKAARKKAGREAERTLKLLVERDREGMRAVVRAREAVTTRKENAKDTKGKEKEKEKEKEKAVENDGAVKGSESKKGGYSAAIIKNLGFDPALKAGHGASEQYKEDEKLKLLSALQSSRTAANIELGPRPGKRIRSAVMAPPKGKEQNKGLKENVPRRSAAFGRPVGLISGDTEIDLDEDSSEVEVEAAVMAGVK